jgi:hypothetical protein
MTRHPGGVREFRSHIAAFTDENVRSGPWKVRGGYTGRARK